ncbi:MAG TPA: sugar porter family MFS transporter [Gemmataceae bacterium]|jgi:sugar porter (SP) family MFS transporter|nr:sugar porter family MFS transporter [Gemmataceae bacterium]
MNGRILFWSVTASLAGFLFGFDTVVISGAEQTIESLWHLKPEIHGLALASALYGTVLGAIFGGWPTNWFGRKPMLLAVGLLFVISALGCGFAWDVWSFIAFRFVGGIGIGTATVAAPLYIAEIAPPKHRGFLAGMFQFNIVFGIIMAYLSNFLLQGIGENAWRWMLGVAALPSIVYAVMCLGIPESPRWLLSRRRDRSAGIAVLRLIEPDAPLPKVEAEADALLANSETKLETGGFWTWRLHRPILLAFLVAFFNQMSGVNAILYFAPRIFQLTGLGAQTALLRSVGIGVTNLIFTFVGLWLIDRLGRRTLLLLGSFGYILSLGLTSWAFFTEHYAIVPACIFGFIAAHAIGQGTVIWVLISEVFPDRYRAAGNTLGCGTHWVMAALITTAFPVAVSSVPAGWIFLFFCAMMVLHLLWVITMVPETKGVPLEEIERLLATEDASR